MIKYYSNALHSSAWPACFQYQHLERWRQRSGQLCSFGHIEFINRCSGHNPPTTHAASTNGTTLAMATVIAHPRRKVNKADDKGDTASPENSVDSRCAPSLIERQKEVNGAAADISTGETPTDATTNSGIPGYNVPPVLPGQTRRNLGLLRGHHLCESIRNRGIPTTRWGAINGNGETCHYPRPRR